MSVVLSTAQREQAGSDSYNRFEYQAHWIVYHIINQLEKKPKCIVFCEFHDDMAQLADGDGSQFEFIRLKQKKIMMIGLYLSFRKERSAKTDLIRNLFLVLYFITF